MDRAADGKPGAVWISAAAQSSADAGLELLREAIVERLELKLRLLWLRLPVTAGAQRAKLFAAGVVRDERTLDSGEPELLVEMPSAEADIWAAEPGVRVSATCTDERGYLESPAPPTVLRVRH